MTININEGVLHSKPKCSKCSSAFDRLSVVERTAFSPTISVRSTSSLDKFVLRAPTSVTPYHLLWKLGIASFNHNNVYTAGEINAHYSVHSYLWAMEYWGDGVFITKWPETSNFPRRGEKTVFGYRWAGVQYRPEYAFVALLNILGWDDEEVAYFVQRMLQLPQPRRLPALRRTAAHYLQNPVDCFAPDGFWELIYDGGTGFNEFKLL